MNRRSAHQVRRPLWLLVLSLSFLAACDRQPPDREATAPPFEATALPLEATALADDALEPVPPTATLAIAVPTATHTSVAVVLPSVTPTVAATDPIALTATATATASPTPLPATTTPQPTTAPRPTATPTAVPTIDSLPDERWSVTYFDNVDLAGQPFATESVETLGYHWGMSRPAGFPEAFAMRWQRNVALNQQDFRVYIWHRGGVRLRLNGVTLIDDWQTGPWRLHQVGLGVQTATYFVEVEHYQLPGPANFHIWTNDAGAAGWAASYWNNRDLSGPPALTRQENELVLDWAEGAPGPGLERDNFSARWSRTIDVTEGLYEFAASYDDGLRLYVDGFLLIDDWQTGVQRQRQGEIWLAAGQHELVVEYFEGLGFAAAELSWRQLSGAYSGWRGEYFANPLLAGVPALIREDFEPEFNWNQSAPAEGIGADEFSVRWTRRFNLEDGLYRFIVRADDGFRLYVDGILVLDKWPNDDLTAFHQINLRLAGIHVIELHYFDQLANASVDWHMEYLGPAPVQ